MTHENRSGPVLALVFLFLVGLACSGTADPTSQKQPSSATPAPSTVPTASPDPETIKLQEKLAELEKKVNEQQKPGPAPQTTPQVQAPQLPQTSAPPVQQPPVTRDTRGGAWVNSPGDGFLALRSEPSSEFGYRIVQMPHGANVRVWGCQGYGERVSGRSGRWCRVSYGSYSGWAFDAWLVH